jgi:hypothetical protein
VPTAWEMMSEKCQARGGEDMECHAAGEGEEVEAMGGGGLGEFVSDTGL